MKTTVVNESGSALIAALCLIFTGGMLVTAVMAMSHYNDFNIAAHTELQRSIYRNEGCANRIGFLLAADREQNNNVNLGMEDYYSDAVVERFVADSVIHELDYYGTKVEFSIYDASGGMNLSAAQFQTSLRTLQNWNITDTQWTESLQLLTDLLTDYMDSDDFISNEGMESTDYETLQKQPLPRNGAIQYREELLYIPGIIELFPPDVNGRLSGVCLIPPEGMSNRNGRTNFFSASALQIQSTCDLEGDELKLVLDSREQWRREKILMSDQVDVLLLGVLQQQFSWQESGNYTVVIGPPAGAKQPMHRLVVSFPAYEIGGPSDGTVHYLEWMLF